jgi:V/A-type H+-transporting ATPase subunit E
MTQEIQNLIEKIQQEGVQAAETKAAAIEQAALEQAREIVRKAQAEAQVLIQAAQDRLRQEEAVAQANLAQAGRDFLIALRQQINTLLTGVITRNIDQALGVQELVRIIAELARDAGTGQISVALSRLDAEVLEKGFLHKLQDELKKEIVLRPSDDIRRGFTISFDAGKSCFDFSDKALAEYIGTVLKPKLDEILKAAVNKTEA